MILIKNSDNCLQKWTLSAAFKIEEKLLKMPNESISRFW